MATEFLEVINRAAATLDGNIADDALSLDVGVGEGVLFPVAYPFHITIEDEILSCTNVAGDTLTVVRAQQGTVAVAHLTGVDVQLRITAKSISDLNTAVNALEVKEFFVPATCGEGGEPELSSYGDYGTVDIGANTYAAFVIFRVPHDFTTLTSAEFVIIPEGTEGASNIDIFSDYAAEGEAYNANSESEEAATYGLTDDQII
ncbi:MAG TPA: hypothetical protein VMV84_05190, partial [Dehalococcoidales bacterium]|nr:hypothetical protein [Dehalococcoidales bacterium]